MAGSPLAALFDKRASALRKARFAAWWKGADFDEAAFLASLEAAPAANDGGEAVLFDAPTDPRLAALQALWGEGRLAPGEPMMEELVGARLAVAATGLLGVSGAGLAKPVTVMAQGHPGPIAAYEWRAESRAALKAGLAAADLGERAAVHSLDLETGQFEAETLDGLISIDDFTFCANPQRLAVQIARGLKPGASALVECYTGTPGADVAPAFASAFAEPQVQDAKLLGEQMFEAGLRIEEEEDLTPTHIELSRTAFRQVKTSLDAAGLEPRALQELAWEMETWAVRLALLDRRRLERRAWRVTRR